MLRLPMMGHVQPVAWTVWQFELKVRDMMRHAGQNVRMGMTTCASCELWSRSAKEKEIPILQPDALL